MDRPSCECARSKVESSERSWEGPRWAPRPCSGTASISVVVTTTSYEPCVVSIRPRINAYFGAVAWQTIEKDKRSWPLNVLPTTLLRKKLVNSQATITTYHISIVVFKVAKNKISNIKITTDHCNYNLFIK
ncbi:hypothetical protein PUN28_016202 [Cardiocondyla obscurior]|uniref:Uncharacterized protein n=1 Tax=Cardiocondyla obscurior TaxID=286306 RepID=A0AAW2ERE3_9HYME